MNTNSCITSAGETIFSGSNTGDGSGGTGYGGGAANEGEYNNQGSPFAGGAGNAGDIDGTPSAATRYGTRGTVAVVHTLWVVVLATLQVQATQVQVITLAVYFS